MGHKEIIESVAKQVGVRKEVAKKIIEAYWDTITTLLSQEKKVELKPYLKLALVKRTSRKARNPKTGEMIVVPEKTVVKITPYSKLKKIAEEKG